MGVGAAENRMGDVEDDGGLGVEEDWELQHKPEEDFSSCIKSCFPLTDNVSLGDSSANSLHEK